MNKKTASFACLIFLLSFNIYFRWPVENHRITSSFGESRGDHFHDGIDIISNNDSIYPVEDGELVFFWDRSIFPTENYPGGGNYKILKHKDDQYSLYLHLEDNSDFKKSYKERDLLGSMGNTGRSYGKHLHLSFLNINENKSINPLFLLPKFEDKRNPHISEIYIRIGDRYYTIKENETLTLRKNYPLLLKIFDTIRGQERLGIFRLKLNLNGKNIMETDFSEICYSKKDLTINNKTFQNLFDEKGYYKASDVKYNNGLNRLIIIADDYSGNRSYKEISFNVKLEID